MITFLAILLIATILVLSLVQTLLVIQYQWFHRDAESDLTDAMLSENAPRAAIILCLRGQEESVPECLACLVGQDYPNYELHIAFDSESDPAIQQVNEFFQASSADVHLHFFEPQQKCSYKCSGIVHVLDQLGEEIEIVAFCDGDAIVDENWLNELATPLIADAKIGATTGNRWFSPFDNGLGGLVRKLWNSAAVVQMQAYDIAWGGSMATRPSTIRDCGLKEVWSRSFCEDTSLAEPLKQHNLKLHRIPGLVIENREATTLKQCFHWISRQLMTVRLHHPRWIMVMGHGFATLLATIVAPLFIVLLFATGYMIAGRSLLFAWLIYQMTNVALLWMIERCNKKALAARNSVGHEDHSSSGGMLALAMVQIVHPFAFLDAFTASKVSWRGINYGIRGNDLEVRQSS